MLVDAIRQKHPDIPIHIHTHDTGKNIYIYKKYLIKVASYTSYSWNWSSQLFSCM